MTCPSGPSVISSASPGFSVSVQEEQLKGQFFIKSDSHKIEGNKHLMELHLVFNKLLDEQKQELDSASYNANPDYVPPAETESTSSVSTGGAMRWQQCGRCVHGQFRWYRFSLWLRRLCRPGDHCRGGLFALLQRRNITMA
jgi:hypothetical protein